MGAVESIGIGVGCGVVAAALFLIILRTLLTPSLEISHQLAHRFNVTDEEVFRIKIVNRRRWTEAVKLQFELVALTPLAVPVEDIEGRRKFLLFGSRLQISVNRHKYERDALAIRPSELIALPRRKLKDPQVGYAFRVTTHECDALHRALANQYQLVRFRVYAENPWSSRGKTFERVYSTGSDAVCGDFTLGPQITVVEDGLLKDRIKALR